MTILTMTLSACDISTLTKGAGRMKNKCLKGLTLIELVIVMAIIGIILTGVLSFFKPIRQVFVDSTVYEQQRTVQTGIAEYITESTRYCNNMGIYSKSQVANSTQVQ